MQLLPLTVQIHDWKPESLQIQTGPNLSSDAPCKSLPFSLCNRVPTKHLYQRATTAAKLLFVPRWNWKGLYQSLMIDAFSWWDKQTRKMEAKQRFTEVSPHSMSKAKTKKASCPIPTHWTLDNATPLNNCSVKGMMLPSSGNGKRELETNTKHSSALYHHMAMVAHNKAMLSSLISITELPPWKFWKSFKLYIF